MLKSIDCITIIFTLDGMEKINTEKNNIKTVWTITPVCKRAKTHLARESLYLKLMECTR